MRALIITADVVEKAAQVVAEAKKHPLSLASAQALAFKEDKAVFALADREKGQFRPHNRHVDIPVGFLASYSVEEQPVGLCAHLSVSVDTPGNLPSIDAFAEIAKIFGIDGKERGKVWIEEFEPGHSAVNLVVPLGKLS